MIFMYWVSMVAGIAVEPLFISRTRPKNINLPKILKEKKLVFLICPICNFNYDFSS